MNSSVLSYNKQSGHRVTQHAGFRSALPLTCLTYRIDRATLSSGMPSFTLRLTGHTHDRESPIQNFSTAPKKLGAHISSPVWPPIPTEFVSYLGNLRCDAFTALKSVQSARNESFLAGSDNFHRVRSVIEFEAWLVEQHTCEKVIGLIQEMMDSAARLSHKHS